MSDKIIPKNYGSIPHFSFSRLGEKDYKCCEGHEKILTEKARDWKDLIIVTEKLDGSNVGILKKDDNITPITRAGYHANTSQYKQHQMFNKWVYKYYQYFYHLLNEGERLCGEWLLLVHGTKYKIESEWDLFRPFDIIDKNNNRITYLELRDRLNHHNWSGCMLDLKLPKLLHLGQPVRIKHIEKKLQEIEKNRIDKCEGAVYRCEREGKVDFLVKYVRQDKIDGKYLKQEIYNYNKDLIL